MIKVKPHHVAGHYRCLPHSRKRKWVVGHHVVGYTRKK